MKKNLIKKVFAVSLSIAMACSLLPAANPVTASAAAPYVSLKTTFKTLKVGQKYKMTLKNNTVSWKIKKVETTDKTIATVYGKTTSQVMIKGKSEGRATIRVHLKTSKRKANNTKTLRCRVKVVTATPAVDPTEPTKTDATVTTQAELDTALKDTKITKITIKPAAAVDFVIGQGSYPNVDLIVDAPQSDVENSATFKSITVENIKEETFIEKGIGNSIKWNAEKGRLVVSKDAALKTLDITKTNSKITVKVEEGTVSAINVSAKVELIVEGKLPEGAAAIAVNFSSAAAEAKITTAVKVAVSTLAKITAVFEKGAEDSTIKLETTNISATVTNNTTKAIEVTKNDSTKQTIAVGAKNSTVNATNTTTPVTPGTIGGNTSGTTTNKGKTEDTVNTPSALSVVVSGSVYGVTTISSASLSVYNASEAFTISGNGLRAIEYTLSAKAGTWSQTLANGTLRQGDAIKDSNGKLTGYENVLPTLNVNMKGAPIGEKITLTLTLKVKETDKLAAGPSIAGTADITISAGEKDTFNYSDENVTFRNWK